MKIIKDKLELAMAKSCITLKELSSKSGIRQETIVRIKNDIQNAQPSTVGKLAKALNVNVEELIESEAATSNQFSTNPGVHG